MRSRRVWGKICQREKYLTGPAATLLGLRCVQGVNALVDSAAPDPSELFTVAELAAALGCSRKRIYHWLEPSRGYLKWDLSTGKKRIRATDAWREHLAAQLNDTGRARDQPAA